MTNCYEKVFLLFNSLVIENFLTNDECDEIISQAKSSGLQDSQLYPSEEMRRNNQAVYGKYHCVQ